jgi:cysteine desulfurase family protein (TIGR01976 family)
MSFTPDIVDHCRRQFPALSRRIGDHAAAYFDGPAGSQVPQRVIEAVSHYMAHTNANHGGRFATSRESDRMLEDAHRALADFVGTLAPETIIFGPNMTSLTFALSRSIARTWKEGDEVLVTRLDHDGNVSPWVLAAGDVGARLRFAEFEQDDLTLDLDDLRKKLSPRTRLIAVGCASNATGGVNPVREICAWAREVGALTFLDAVHYAPHALVDVESLGCDFLVCSAYKFFGPHVGVLWGRRELLEELAAYKVRPADDSLPGKWMTGTQNHECIAGAAAAVDYLADLGRHLAKNAVMDRRTALREAYAAIGQYERSLVEHLLNGLAAIENVRVWGITDPERFSERLPTVSITHARLEPVELAERLADAGIFVWHGNYYALELTESLGLEPQGMVRLGLLHYNTRDEVDRLIEVLAAL